MAKETEREEIKEETHELEDEEKDEFEEEENEDVDDEEEWNEITFFSLCFPPPTLCLQFFTTYKA